MSRSLLDNVPVREEKTFSLDGKSPPSIERTLKIVSKCPKCGAPIYGDEHIWSTSEAVIKHTCNCRFSSFQETCQGK